MNWSLVATVVLFLAGCFGGPSSSPAEASPDAPVEGTDFTYDPNLTKPDVPTTQVVPPMIVEFRAEATTEYLIHVVRDTQVNGAGWGRAGAAAILILPSNLADDPSAECGSGVPGARFVEAPPGVGEFGSDSNVLGDYLAGDYLVILAPSENANLRLNFEAQSNDPEVPPVEAEGVLSDRFVAFGTTDDFAESGPAPYSVSFETSFEATEPVIFLTGFTVYILAGAGSSSQAISVTGPSGTVCAEASMSEPFHAQSAPNPLGVAGMAFDAGTYTVRGSYESTAALSDGTHDFEYALIGIE